MITPFTVGNVFSNQRVYMVLHVENLEVVRGERVLLTFLEFTLRAGDMLTLTGRNGVGKSTLLTVLAGLLAPHKGNVRWGNEEELCPQVHFLAHKDGLKNALSVYENLSFSGALAGFPNVSIQEALKTVGLSHVRDMPAGWLSAGQRRRVALARLLIAHRPLWLLDEPTSALDTASQGILMKVMRGHLAGGGIIIAATHAPLEGASQTLNLDAFSNDEMREMAS
jgi:heme exporter protein A